MAIDFSGYRTVGQIGIGARSTISLVVRRATGEQFALKRVLRRSADDDKFVEQALGEYEVSSRVDHPYLRKSHDISIKKKWFKITELRILMEYVVGKTLEHSKPTDLGETIGLFRRIAIGLHALHEAGFVHADVKPSNVLVTEDNKVKIIDFGQSCPMGHKKSRIQGTPDYIAPEQVQRLPLDQRTDVFNLGATLYWALTDKTFPTDVRQGPRHGSHEIRGRVRSPKELDPKVPAALSQLAMDCCANAPHDRPADMKQFVARLQVAEGLWKKNLAQQEQPSARDPRADSIAASPRAGATGDA